MKKENLQFVLRTIAHVFENTAQKCYIEEFKAKYKGVRWCKSIEHSLLRTCRNMSNIDKWIDNLTSFMREKEIAIDIKA